MPLFDTRKRLRISDADQEPGFLENKLAQGDSITITKEGTGVNELLRIAASVSGVFSTDFKTSQVFASTASSTPQDAFAGLFLAPPVDGNYVVFFECDLRASSNNGIMGISIGINSTIVEESGSLREMEGNDRGSNIVIFPMIGLVTADTIHGLFRMVTGAGTAEIRNRSMLLMRIG